jgi:stearoyl-CoA desaturase (Delta-9 desaturase)
VPVDLPPAATADVATNRGTRGPEGLPDLGFNALDRSVTMAFVVLPAVALVLAVVRFWGNGVTVLDIAIASVLYVVVGYGITVGFHRMLTHRSFVPSRPLKIILAVAGSMAFEGGPLGWIAAHRRHHVFSDRAGDPHSPHRYPSGKHARLRGLAHAHVGWLFKQTRSSAQRYARDLLADRDIVMIDRLFPMWCVLSLAIPFSLGYLFGHGLTAALTALLWAGGVRVFVQHHVTWSINSICHTFGKRPFKTKDHSGNVAVLAVATLGESWHNGHHAIPRSARHGLLPHQWDPSARLILCFEQLGWATDVVWPDRQHVLAALAPPSERLDAFLGEIDDRGQMASVDRVAMVAVVGNEDGAHHVGAELFQGLNDVGFTIASGGLTYWVGEAMHKIDYKDLASTPEKAAQSTHTMVVNPVHLARFP